MLGKKKEKKEKKEKKAKKAKEKKENGAKKSKKKLLIMVALLAVIVIAVLVTRKLRGGSGAEDTEQNVSVDPPLEYELGGTKLPALPVLNADIAVYLEKPVLPTQTASADGEPMQESAGEEAAAEEDAAQSGEGAAQEDAAVESTAVTYRYEGLSDPRGMIVSYANLLSLKDVGFVYVDESMYETTAPDFETEEGAAHLVQSAPEEGMMFSVQLQWSPKNCAVTVDYTTGGIETPPPPEPVETMSYAEAMDYFTSLSPADLGLAGNSMQNYRVYSLDGVVLVDGNPCIHMNVYSVDEVLGTNKIAGEYFLTGDRSHIYRLDADGVLTELTG